MGALGGVGAADELVVLGAFAGATVCTVPGGGEGVVAVDRGEGVAQEGKPFGVVGDCWAKLRHWITSVFILLARDLSGIARRTWLMYLPSLVL